MTRHWRFGGPGRPPVRMDQIRGEAMVSMDLAWPALLWNEGRCWAYLHDLESPTLQRLMDRLRKTELERSAPHGPLDWS